MESNQSNTQAPTQSPEAPTAPAPLSTSTMMEELNRAQVQVSQEEPQPQPQPPAEAPQEAPKEPTQLEFATISKEVGDKTSQALGQEQETPQDKEVQKQEAPPAKEVYHYIHPEFVKHSTQYKTLQEQTQAVSELSELIREQLARAHEGKEVKVINQINDNGQLEFSEERMPTGEDIVELQRQYNIANTYKNQLQAQLETLENEAQSAYSVVDTILKAANENIFKKVDFNKGSPKDIYGKLSAVIPQYIRDIPVFDALVKLLALNEVMAQALVSKTQYNSMMRTAQQHAGPGTVDAAVSEDEIKKLERQMARVMGWSA